ncbi:MAG: aminoglycoside phosphotransferase family protein [Gemmatimonadota bacterium]|nr:aminoglycoside phosphotransferase family protein [Gemmatimonadota bacterium]
MTGAAVEPWTPDRHLTAETARRSIGRQFGGIDTRDLRLLGAGWEFDAYLTCDGWVFRFPRRREYAGVFEREPAIHALAAAALPETVAIPVVELWGSPDPDFPYRFAGHRYLPGLAADDPAVEVAAFDKLARDLGEAIAAIHAIDVEAAVAVGVPPAEDETATWLTEAREAAVRVRCLGDAAERAGVWLDADPPVPPPHRGPGRVLHNDVCPDHLLVDTGSGRLRGILDWTDTAIGDPALDFVPLVAWRGWPFTRDVLGSYGAPDDPGFESRLGFMARVMAVVWLDEANRIGGDVEKHLRWLANAFAAPALFAR